LLSFFKISVTDDDRLERCVLNFRICLCDRHALDVERDVLNGWG
jgi:hypothetical protein